MDNEQKGDFAAYFLQVSAQIQFRFDSSKCITQVFKIHKLCSLTVANRGEAILTN